MYNVYDRAIIATHKRKIKKCLARLIELENMLPEIHDDAMNVAVVCVQSGPPLSGKIYISSVGIMRRAGRRCFHGYAGRPEDVVRLVERARQYMMNVVKRHIKTSLKILNDLDRVYE